MHSFDWESQRNTDYYGGGQQIRRIRASTRAVPDFDGILHAEGRFVCHRGAGNVGGHLKHVGSTVADKSRNQQFSEPIPKRHAVVQPSSAQETTITGPSLHGVPRTQMPRLLGSVGSQDWGVASQSTDQP